jgi:hypothetical protein
MFLKYYLGKLSPTAEESFSAGTPGHASISGRANFYAKKSFSVCQTILLRNLANAYQVI